MMALILAAHVVAALLAPALLAKAGARRGFLIVALVPAIAFSWALLKTSEVTGSGAGAIIEELSWVASLDLTLSFRLSTLTWVMTLLVTGIGALVLMYCAYYFRPDDHETRRFSGLLVAFAGTMLGLVLADDLLLLYVFWELTTVLSYLLIGHNPERKANRRSAMQALIVTTFGGLAMLVGIVIIGQQAGTYRVSEVLASPPAGTAVAVALVLMLVGAITKSALVPFHFWLPGAMSAPTPVSAYLHAAAMVKAGVFFVALFAPSFADTMPWRPVLLVLGTATMLVGAWRALRQVDLKLLLAYGTVSQLGFLIALVGAGTRSQALAGVAMLVAHALFKATLFLVVGIIDRCFGTRDLRELSGLGRRMPVLFAMSVLAAASMAGVPPLAGFVAKEAAFTGLVDIAEAGDGTGIGPVAGWALVAGLVAGSALTAAYSARFIWGAFAGKRDVEACEPRKMAPWGFMAPTIVLALAGLALGVLGDIETDLIGPYAERFPAGAHEPSLSLWHGINTALILSVLALATGALLFWRRAGVERLQARLTWPLSADALYRTIMRLLDRLAVEVTGATQRGSLPIYLAVIFLALVVVPGGILVNDNIDGWDVHGWDTAAQAAVAGVMVVGAILAARARRRLKAVVLAGVTGYGMAMLFMLHGAPDLALTQVLVETVTLVVFVLVLRRLPSYFSDRPLTGSRWWRLALGVIVGLVMAGMTLTATSARTHTPVSVGFAEPAVSFGGGHNIVNVTLVDIRAWDTMGEISVLVVAATGVASLIFLITSRTGRWRPDNQTIAGGAPGVRGNRIHRNVWLRAGPTLQPDRRSIIFEVVTRIIFHVVIVFSIYLLFAGHNDPGGGFAGGLVAGLALMIRYLAGGRHELDEAAPVDAGLVLGIGLFIATGSGLVPLVFGGQMLQSAVVDVVLPVLGEVHFSTSVFFDVGVYLVVIGLMLDVLRSLGGGIDRDYDETAGDDTNPADDQTTAVGDAPATPLQDTR